MQTLGTPYGPRPYVLDRDTAPAFWLVATLWLIHATCAQTASRFSLLEQWMPDGLGPPTHRHQFANEGFYVLDGTVAFNAEGGTLRAGPGTFVHLPRLLPHSFSVDTSEAHVLNFYAPGGFELVVMSAARAADDRNRRPTVEESMPPNPDEIRILSTLFGVEEVTALPFTQPPADELMVTESGTWSIGSFKTATADDATAVDAFGMSWRTLASGADTDGTYDLSDVRAPAGTGMPLRTLGQDEALFVLDGDLELTLDGTERRASTGAFVYVPAGSSCSWRSTATGTHLLVFHIPGEFTEALSRNAGNEEHVRAFLEAGGTRFIETPAP